MTPPIHTPPRRRWLRFTLWSLGAVALAWILTAVVGTADVKRYVMERHATTGGVDLETAAHGDAALQAMLRAANQSRRIGRAVAIAPFIVRIDQLQSNPDLGRNTRSYYLWYLAGHVRISHEER